MVVFNIAWFMQILPGWLRRQYAPAAARLACPPVSDRTPSGRPDKCIHQEHHHTTGHIAHHSAKSLIFPLPAPGAAPKRDPIRWDAAEPYRGLGFRRVEAKLQQAQHGITEFPLKKGVPVVLEFMAFVGLLREQVASAR
jgi:hypothetical protein